MSLPLAASFTALAAILTNRIVAMGIGLWFQVPVALLFGLLLFLDAVQIPVYYQMYEQGSSFLFRIPFFKSLARRDLSKSILGRWATPLGGFGVMLVAAMPTFGGGIWSSAFLAYGLGLKRNVSYAWIFMGSLLSYCTLYWILNTLILTFRYFMH